MILPGRSCGNFIDERERGSFAIAAYFAEEITSMGDFSSQLLSQIHTRKLTSFVI